MLLTPPPGSDPGETTCIINLHFKSQILFFFKEVVHDELLSKLRVQVVVDDLGAAYLQQRNIVLKLSSSEKKSQMSHVAALASRFDNGILLSADQRGLLQGSMHTIKLLLFPIQYK